VIYGSVDTPPSVLPLPASRPAWHIDSVICCSASAPTSAPWYSILHPSSRLLDISDARRHARPHNLIRSTDENIPRHALTLTGIQNGTLFIQRTYVYIAGKNRSSRYCKVYIRCPSTTRLLFVTPASSQCFVLYTEYIPSGDTLQLAEMKMPAESFERRGK